MTIDVAEVERTLEELAAAVSQPANCESVNPRILSPLLSNNAYPVGTPVVVCKVKSNKKGFYTVTLNAPNAISLPYLFEIKDVTAEYKVWLFTPLVPASLPGETYDIEFRKFGCTGEDGVRFMPISFHN